MSRMSDWMIEMEVAEIEEALEDAQSQTELCLGDDDDGDAVGVDQQPQKKTGWPGPGPIRLSDLCRRTTRQLHAR